MTTEVQMTEDFQQRIYKKIRDDIGSLMTEADIKKLVEATIERTFFQPVKKPGGYSYREEFDPPLIQQLVRELVEPSLRRAIETYLEAHQEDVGAAIDKALAGGLSAALARAFDQILSSAMAQLQTNLTTALLNR